MRLLIIAIMSVAAASLAAAQAPGVPPGPPATEIKGTVDVVVTNDPSQPIPVDVQNDDTEELFVHADTYALGIGEAADVSKSLFTVPPGKTLIIEYVDAFNATVPAPNGQEARVRIFYAEPGGVGFPGISLLLRTESGINEGGGQKVFLPVPSDTEVRGSVGRADASVQTTWRITIAGRLVSNP